MKRIFGFVAIAAMAVSLNTGCSKDDGNGGNGGGGATVNVRVTGWADDWDSYVFEYNDEGRVVKASRNDGEREWNFAYNGNEISVTGYSEFTITLGANGYASTYVNEYDETYTYTYDNDGYVTQIKKNGEVCSNVQIQDGCIIKWSKFSDQDGDGTPEEVWKEHTYSNVRNVGGIHNIYAEVGAGRWLQELGFFGKPTQYLCSGNGWDYSSTPSTLEYEFDSNNCVKKEIKTGGSGDDVYVENYFYTWETLE